MEQQVADKTRELLETNVNLHNSNEDLLQFASIASHDLQEPLRKIRTFTSVFIKDFGKEVPHGGQEVINKIKTSAERMSQLIKEVLEYSKLTHSARKFIQTDLDAVLKNVMKDLDLLISETHASIDYGVALPIIAAIPIQINQLFYNLITNAFKFCKAGAPPQLAITSRTLSLKEAKKIAGLSDNLAYLEIIFSDKGIGFEQQFGDQIFRIFERLNSVEKFEGTGIGLALCKKIVENHHGQIFARSDVNDGARFHVVLPLGQL